MLNYNGTQKNVSIFAFKAPKTSIKDGGIKLHLCCGRAYHSVFACCERAYPPETGMLRARLPPETGMHQKCRQQKYDGSVCYTLKLNTVAKDIQVASVLLAACCHKGCYC